MIVLHVCAVNALTIHYRELSSTRSYITFMQWHVRNLNVEYFLH